MYKVIIIGAGISGLSAGKTLQNSGIENFLILEASNKVGGRIHTSHFGSGENCDGIIELGAQWIHGEANDFYKLIKDSYHLHKRSSWEGQGEFISNEGEVAEGKLVKSILEWIEQELENIDENIESENQDSSVGEYLRANFENWLFEQKDIDADMAGAIFQWGMSFQRIDNACNTMDELSLKQWSDFKINDGENYNNFANGVQSFVDEIFLSPMKERIKLKYPVIEIDWSEKCVKVKTKEREYDSEIVLITPSIGVLQSHTIKFVPPLPSDVTKAIETTGFGPLTKIFLEWEKPWWPKETKGFQLLWPKHFIDCTTKYTTNEEELKESWSKAITGFDPVLDNPNVLLAWLGGPEAVYTEKLSHEEIMKTCTRILSNVSKIQVPEPKQVAVSRWNCDPYVRGAYCFRSKTSDSIDSTSILSNPICKANNIPVILFAGEALSKEQYSTLHGAYDSGQCQAKKILQYFQSQCNSLITTNLPKYSLEQNVLLSIQT